MQSLVVHQVVPLSGTLVFNQWLPDEASDAICFEFDGLHVRLWIDLDCVDPIIGEECTPELIRKWTNINVTRVKVDVVVDEVDDALATFVAETSVWKEDVLRSEDANRVVLGTAYAELGIRVLAAVERAVVRLESWAYAEKDHHWLKPRTGLSEMMMSRNNEFRSTVSIEGRPATRWCPPSHDTISVVMPSKEIGLRPQTWLTAVAFVTSDQRPRLPLELISNAYSLLDQGRHRSAVIEAVCALEVALNAWVAAPSADSLTPDASSVAPDGLLASVKHLGFTTSLRFLVPLVLAAGQYDAQQLASACKAVAARHNIVHNGQREVALKTARGFLMACKAMTEVFVDATVAEAAPA